MNIVLYATTSGATESVAETLADLLGVTDTLLIDLRKDALPTDAKPDWLFAGTPTYGRGDWHYAWMQRHKETVGLFAHARRIALFGLGDSVHHAATFAGGIGHLSRFCQEINVTVEGAVAESRRPSPSLVGGYFPGLVVEYARDRRQVPAMLAEWLGVACALRAQAPKLPIA